MEPFPLPQPPFTTLSYRKEVIIITVFIQSKHSPSIITLLDVYQTGVREMIIAFATQRLDVSSRNGPEEANAPHTATFLTRLNILQPFSNPIFR